MVSKLFYTYSRGLAGLRHYGMTDTLSTRGCNAVACDEEGLTRKEVRSHAQAYTVAQPIVWPLKERLKDRLVSSCDSCLAENHHPQGAPVHPRNPTFYVRIMAEIRRKLVIVGDGACGKVRPLKCTRNNTRNELMSLTDVFVDSFL